MDKSVADFSGFLIRQFEAAVDGKGSPAILARAASHGPILGSKLIEAFGAVPTKQAVQLVIDIGVGHESCAEDAIAALGKSSNPAAAEGIADIGRAHKAEEKAIDALGKKDHFSSAVELKKLALQFPEDAVDILAKLDAMKNASAFYEADEIRRKLAERILTETRLSPDKMTESFGRLAALGGMDAMKAAAEIAEAGERYEDAFRFLGSIDTGTCALAIDGLATRKPGFIPLAIALLKPMTCEGSYFSLNRLARFSPNHAPDCIEALKAKGGSFAAQQIVDIGETLPELRETALATAIEMREEMSEGVRDRKTDDYLERLQGRMAGHAPS